MAKSTIGIEEIKILFETAEKLYDGELLHKDAVAFLVTKDINPNSAGDYLNNYARLVEGRSFPRTMNILATNYYLENILKNKGVVVLRKALDALMQHIDYYEDIQNTNMKGLRNILKEYESKYGVGEITDTYFSESLDEVKVVEGATKTIKVNVYERSAYARKQAVEFHGCICAVCGFDFEAIYGIIGKGFIHIHHLKELSEIKEKYELDYKNDLVPVCPNCHSMLHKESPALTIEELKKRLKS